MGPKLRSVFLSEGTPASLCPVGTEQDGCLLPPSPEVASASDSETIHAQVCGVPSVTASQADDHGRRLSMGWWRLAVQH